VFPLVVFLRQKCQAKMPGKNASQSNTQQSQLYLPLTPWASPQIETFLLAKASKEE
jgi:hypothetical protein